MARSTLFSGYDARGFARCERLKEEDGGWLGGALRVIMEQYEGCIVRMLA